FHLLRKKKFFFLFFCSNKKRIVTIKKKLFFLTGVFKKNNYQSNRIMRNSIVHVPNSPLDLNRLTSSSSSSTVTFLQPLTQTKHAAATITTFGSSFSLSSIPSLTSLLYTPSII